MIISKKILKMIIVIIIIPLLVGCGMSDTPVPTPTYTSLPPTHTLIPPTPSPPPIDVTFYGDECSLSGPAEVPTGQYPFIWNNLSDNQSVDFWVSRIREGSTYQDILDLQDEPGQYFPKPPTIDHAPGYFSFSEEVWLFMLEEPGNYYISVGASTHSMWNCGPSFQVIETPPE